jgi:hypothetical protein
MPKSDLLQSSLPRVELDYRSREARLRLEHVERLLTRRALRKPSWLRRVLRSRGSRTEMGEQIEDRSANAAPAGRGPRQGRRMPGETGGLRGSLPAGPPVSWPNCCGAARTGGARSHPTTLA